MIDGIGAESHLAKRILAERSGKVKGVRINCVGDQAGDPARQFVQVDVPKTHPLFNLESDDPFNIPNHLDLFWVAKSYGAKYAGKPDLAENPMLRLLQLLLASDYEEPNWGEVSRRRAAWEKESVLVVYRQGDLEVKMVKAMCRMIEELVISLVEVNRHRGEEGRREILDEITMEQLEEFVEE